MKIGICIKCKKRGEHVRIHILPHIKEKCPLAAIEIKCLSFCGPGSMRPFVVIDDEVIFTQTDEELLEEIVSRYNEVYVTE